ncbi:hypothetical protein FTO70_02860 [Methanosarcina sp. KYL-1]|uniref:hypothetical protein n=1 Tax=Methanosarcina sp. KYL-1 TaxID=2602068 RepID=UPI0021018ABF|nr:hypothetical protein [Methanosarcina sp. KYL-1]MCQ1534648.1 hypothetical protein [Methanosarcina sp. KYL-1]
MPEENKKILPVINQPVKVKPNVQSPYKEINISCGCGSASCDNCPGALGIEPGSPKDIVYRNVFVYLTIVIIVLLVTYAVKQILTSMLI